MLECGHVRTSWICNDSIVQYQPEKRLHEGPELIAQVLKCHLTQENLERREGIDLSLLHVHDITSGTSGDLSELVVLIIVEGGDSGELWVTSFTTSPVVVKNCFLKFTVFMNFMNLQA